MKKKINKVTGNVELTFSAKLLSVSDKVFNFNNEKETPFRVCGIQFKDVKGRIQKITAVMYEKSYRHGITIGESYLATAVQTDDQPFINISHLPYLDQRASNKMFGFDMENNNNFKESANESANETTDETTDEVIEEKQS